MAKLCCNCKHYIEDDDKCHAPQNFNYDLVTGARTYKSHIYCFSHRKNGWLATRFFESCGKEGRWFEAVKYPNPSPPPENP